MGSGGVSGGQLNTAAGGQSSLAGTGVQNQQQQYGQFAGDQKAVTAFNTNRMNNGLPFYRNLTDYNAGTVAQAYAPARAQLLRNTSQYSNMPSGYRDALLNNLNSQQARTFDSTLSQSMMANELAKQQGMAGLQGEQQIAGNQALGYGGQALNANSSLFGGPRKTGVGGAIGGAVQGTVNSFAGGAGRGLAMGA